MKISGTVPAPLVQHNCMMRAREKKTRFGLWSASVKRKIFQTKEAIYLGMSHLAPNGVRGRIGSINRWRRKQSFAIRLEIVEIRSPIRGKCQGVLASLLLVTIDFASPRIKIGYHELDENILGPHARVACEKVFPRK